MSEIKVNKISQRSGTAITLGNSGTDFQLPSGADIIAQSGSVITIAAGATITNNGTATGFGPTGAVNWNTTAQTSNVNAVSGNGYFINTTSGALTVFLPAGVAGSIVAVSDYANTAATNKIIITPNGSQKIQGVNSNYEIKVNGGTVTLVYVDSTQGWRPTDAATASSIIEQDIFIVATGGTITTCGDYKIHSFTGPGTFSVSAGAGPVAKVDYLVVAGGGAGGGAQGGGGGAGGFRVSNSLGIPAPTMSPLSNPTGIPVTTTSYPITVGSGGTAGTFNTVSGQGNSSIFSTITSAGGGRGSFQDDSCYSGTPGKTGGSGGSGGGANSSRPGGVGNTPPVSPPQGQNGGVNPVGPSFQNGGGGGAGAVGGNTPSSFVGGPGGVGSYVSPSFAVACAGTTGPVPGVRYFAGGGGGSGGNGPPGTSGGGGSGGSGGGAPGTSWQLSPPGSATAPSGTTNTGGGGGGVTNYANCGSVFGGNGGSGIVIIRYKFQ